MDKEFKGIIIYCDESNNLILIPLGQAEDYSLRHLEAVSDLKSPYSYEQLEEMVFDTFDKCYSSIPDINSKRTVIEKHLNINGYTKATLNKRLISIKWEKEKGYSIRPSKRSKRGVYEYLPLNKHINLGLDMKKGHLAEAIKTAIELSIC